MLLKVLGNIDSFKEWQAKNLRMLSGRINASAILIGSAMRRGVLYDNIIYERFDVPAMNASTFESVIDNEMPVLYRKRGGLFVEINPEAMRKRRQEAGMTQGGLASRMGVTKKNVYEHEKNRLKMSYESAARMERILGKGIIESASIELEETGETNSPGSRFEASVLRSLERMGFDASIIRHAPVNFIAEERKFSVISEADEFPKRIEKNADSLRKFSEITGKPVVAISKSEVNADIPSIDEKSLRSMGSRDIKRLLR
jgi:putative transcriptional regulator